MQREQLLSSNIVLISTFLMLYLKEDNVEAFFTLLGIELHTFGPIYLSECFPKETVLNLGISPFVPRRALRSADQLLLEQPTHKLKLIGLRAFYKYIWHCKEHLGIKRMRYRNKLFIIIILL